MRELSFSLAVVFALTASTLCADDATPLIHQWTFDAGSPTRFNRLGAPPDAIGLETLPGDILKFTHHRGGKAFGVCDGSAAKVALPEYYIFRLGLEGQKTVGGTFHALLRGVAKGGKVVTWKLNVPAALTGPSTPSILCQAPPDVETVTLYLTPSGPNLEGELLLKSADLLKAMTPPPCPDLSAWQIVKNPGFEQAWQYPGNLDSGWQLGGEVKHAEGMVAIGGKRYIEATKGFLRQRVDGMRFPQKYLVTFHAKVGGRLTLLVREDSGASIDLLTLKPALPQGTKEAATQSDGQGGAVWEACPSRPEWKKFFALYPVLQEPSQEARGMYFQFDVENCLLDNVELHPLSPDSEKITASAKKAVAELRELLDAHPDEFRTEMAAAASATKEFERRGRLYPDDYLRQITKLLQQVKMGLLLD